MFWLGFVILGAYWVIWAVDELYFRSRRTLHEREGKFRVLDALLLMAVIGFTLMVPYGDISRWFYALLGIVSCAALLREEYFRSNLDFLPLERVLRALRCMYHPIIIFLIGALWPLLDGLPWLYRQVLPMRVTGLRTLAWIFFWALAAMAAYQAYSTSKSKKTPGNGSGL